MVALNVRLPQSLHERIRRLAEQEGISINQFIVLATAEKALLLESETLGFQYLAARAKRAELRGDDSTRVVKEFAAIAMVAEPDPEDQKL